MPTEIRQDDPAAAALGEFAATTGRARRIGWFDADLVRFATQVNGVDELFLTKLDTLSELDSIPICVGYRLNGKRVPYYELDAYQLSAVQPIYRALRGWRTDIRRVRKFSDLPPRARQYVETIERLVGVPVRWISVGPERDAMIKK
jgi:adenylosuccinate synthase